MYIYICVCDAHMISDFSGVWFCGTPWTVACQVPLSMQFPRHKYWSRLPCLPPGNFPDRGIKPASLMSPTLSGRFFAISTHGKPIYTHIHALYVYIYIYICSCIYLFMFCVCVCVCVYRLPYSELIHSSLLSSLVTISLFFFISLSLFC